MKTADQINKEKADQLAEIERQRLADGDAANKRAAEYAQTLFPAFLKQIETLIEKADPKPYDNGVSICLGDGSENGYVAEMLSKELKELGYRTECSYYCRSDSDGVPYGPDTITFYVKWGPTYAEYSKQ